MTQKLAFVFPGQGSQFVGMLDGFISSNHEIVTAACTEASDVLGYDMAQLIALDPRQYLNQTKFTQPALLTAGVIAWRTWLNDNNEDYPSMLAGHSLGEYTALVCAEAMTFAEGLRLVAKRGELMQQAVAPGVGAMAAILGLNYDQVKQICDTGAQIANINAPGQIVIAGTTQSVAAAIERAKAAGAKRAILLPVSVPSHCDLMRPAAEQFSSNLAAIAWRKPKFVVIHNFDVQPHSDAVAICDVLQKQLYSPVRWVETIEYFMQHGILEILECGPGKVLTGLNKRVAPLLTVRAINESLGAGLC